MKQDKEHSKESACIMHAGDVHYCPTMQWTNIKIQNMIMEFFFFFFFVKFVNGKVTDSPAYIGACTVFIPASTIEDVFLLH